MLVDVEVRLDVDRGDVLDVRRGVLFGGVLNGVCGDVPERLGTFRRSRGEAGGGRDMGRGGVRQLDCLRDAGKPLRLQPLPGLQRGQVDWHGQLGLVQFVAPLP
ncbi:hypothetical protein AB0F52_46240 [Amycolatopsis sp. NPDC024027]|uniref:hypothetical protein n=1 Tax=Amycolatopsis sp. NPDC024027 TaxID=3154327 RepID=UPI0033F6EDCC